VATVASPGHDWNCYFNWGIGEMKKKDKSDSEVPKIYRKASQKDIDIWSAAREKKSQ
jgi:hypothetical protein